MVIFTDPMAAERADAETLKSILAGLYLESMDTVDFYCTQFENKGFRNIGFEELTEHLITSYSRVLEEFERGEDQLQGKISDVYTRNMKTRLGHWVDGGKNGQLRWGIHHFVR